MQASAMGDVGPHMELQAAAHQHLEARLAGGGLAEVQQSVQQHDGATVRCQCQAVALLQEVLNCKQDRQKPLQAQQRTYSCRQRPPARLHAPLTAGASLQARITDSQPQRQPVLISLRGCSSPSIGSPCGLEAAALGRFTT